MQLRGVRQCGSYNGSYMRQKGKQGLAWDRTRRQWFKDHPQEWFYCALKISPNCPGAMRREETTLDHTLARSRRPDLRNDQTNLQPACWPCNEMKGSRESTAFI